MSWNAILMSVSILAQVVSLSAQTPPAAAAPPAKDAEVEEALSLLRQGKGTADLDKALKLLRSGAGRKVRLAMTLLGLCHLQGRGVPQDDSEAANWFRLAAELGHPRGEMMYGLLLREGRGVAADPAAGIGWIRKAAEGGDGGAQVEMGMMLTMGKRMAADPKAALDWFRKASGQQEPEAFNQLGYAYATGTGVEVDEAKAEGYWREASRLGSEEATRNLGILLRRSGRGGSIPAPKSPFQGLRAQPFSGEGILHAVAQGLEEGVRKRWESVQGAPLEAPPFPLWGIPMRPKAVEGKPGEVAWSQPEGAKAPLISVASVKQEYAFLEDHGLPALGGGVRGGMVRQSLLMNPTRDGLELADDNGQHWWFEFDIGSFFGEFGKPQPEGVPPEGEMLRKALADGDWSTCTDAAFRAKVRKVAPSLALLAVADLCAELRAARPDSARIATQAEVLRKRLPFSKGAQRLAGLAFLLAGDEGRARDQRAWYLRLAQDA